MARPIKETPVLEGEDARRFEMEIERNQERKVPKQDYLRAIETFKRIKLES